MAADTEQIFNDRLWKVIDVMRQGYGITYAQIVGGMEIVKHDLLTELQEDSKEDDKELEIE